MTDSDSFLDPDLGRRPILAAGNYGADGSAVLDRYALIDARSGEAKAQGLKCDQFQVVVKTAEHGVVRLFADPPRRQGTVAVKWFRQLGVSDDEMRAMPPGDLGAEAMKERIEDTPVIVTLGIREYTEEATGERVQVNTIKNIVKIGGTQTGAQ